MKKRILEILKTQNEYISGQRLCEELGISRTAVWKNINSLKKEGYVIDSVNNKGYKLLMSPDHVSEEEIEKYLKTTCFGRKVVYFDETDSTNTRAKEAAADDYIHGSLYVADAQTAGKGRRGHSWGSDKGINIYMSYLLKPDIEIGCVSRLTLVAALAVAKALREIDGLDAQIKWPNDVVVNGKKICGILTEMSSEGTDINYVVTGIGVNVNIRDFSGELQDKATSIWIETGMEHDRSMIIGSIANYFECYYEQFEKTGNMEALLDEYNALLVNRDKRVIVVSKDRTEEYTAIALDKDGGLIVRDDAGETHSIISGEVSVRGIYGYV